MICVSLGNALRIGFSLEIIEMLIVWLPTKHTNILRRLNLGELGLDLYYNPDSFMYVLEIISVA